MQSTTTFMTKILHIPFPFFQWRSAYFIPLTSIVLHIPYYASDTKLGLDSVIDISNITNIEFVTPSFYSSLLSKVIFQSILLPQQMNGMLAANPHSLPRQKRIAFIIFREYPGLFLMEFFDS